MLSFKYFSIKKTVHWRISFWPVLLFTEIFSVPYSLFSYSKFALDLILISSWYLFIILSQFSLTLKRSKIQNWFSNYCIWASLKIWAFIFWGFWGLYSIIRLHFLNLYLFIYLFIFREGKGGRKRGRGTVMCSHLSCAPYWGHGP